MKKISCFAIATALLAGSSGLVSADLISEFQPNPAGADPATTPIELSGTPGAAFAGFLTFIETDGAARGAINSSDAISGSYDANGLAVVTLGFDVENPSYTLVFSSAQPTADVDNDNDATLDDVSLFGTVFDAVGIIDAAGDATDYATALGGVEFSTADEFELAFRDASTGQFFGVDTFGATIVDVAGATVAVGDFSNDPLVATFGAINPSLAVIPEPNSLAFLGLIACAGYVRRRR